jgi:hypothetical protein
MSEAEVVITIDLEERTSELYDAIKKPPCFMLLDSTPLLFHTMYHLFHFGFSKFTLIANEKLESEVESFINTCMMCKPRCANTGLNNCDFDRGYYDDSGTALQIISDLVEKGRIKA